MRKHRRHAAHRARGAAVQKLTVDAVREAAFLQQHDDRAIFRRRQRDVRHALAQARRREIYIALGNRGAPFASLADQLEQWTSKRQQIAKLLLEQQANTHIKELLGRLIGVKQATFGPDKNDRERKGLNNPSLTPAKVVLAGFRRPPASQYPHWLVLPIS